MCDTCVRESPSIPTRLTLGAQVPPITMAKLTKEQLEVLFSGVKTGAAGVYKSLGIVQVADDVLETLINGAVHQLDRNKVQLPTKTFQVGEVRVVFDPANFKSTDVRVIQLEQAVKGAIYPALGDVIVQAGTFRAKLVVSSGQQELTRDVVTEAIKFASECKSIPAEGKGFVTTDAQGVPTWSKL